ncbi:MAG: peptidoglycan recognition protein family protein [Actinomycetota bacterium]|nr:peptidoglycan recognition protein family protein [Actinomycetota bacterium]
MTVHHSGLRLRRNRHAPGRFRDWQRYHQSQGWPDIAYHVLIDRHGNIYKGRPSWAEGDTFTDYDPRGHFLVMCEGNFSEQRVPDVQLRALRDVLVWACVRFGVPSRTIRAHREYAATACPGSDLYRVIASERLGRMVRRRLQNGGVELERLCGKAGKRRVAAIERGED